MEKEDKDKNYKLRTKTLRLRERLFGILNIHAFVVVNIYDVEKQFYFVNMK